MITPEPQPAEHEQSMSKRRLSWLASKIRISPVVRRGLLQIVGAWSIGVASCVAAFIFVETSYGPARGYLPALLLTLPCIVLLVVSALFVHGCREFAQSSNMPPDLAISGGSRWAPWTDGRTRANVQSPFGRAPARLGFWGSTCAVAGMVAVYLSSSWPPLVSVQLGMLWGCAAITSTWLLAHGFAVLRSVPGASHPASSASAPLRKRLLSSLLGACACAVLAPVILASLWLCAPQRAQRDAETVAARLGALVERGAWETLGAELALRPDVQVRLGDRVLGNVTIAVPSSGSGALDLEEDGRADVVVVSATDAMIAVPLLPVPTGVLLILFALGGVGIAIFMVTAARIASDLEHDLTLATQRLSVLHDPHSIPNAQPATPRVEELHALMERIGRLLHSASEATVAHYVAIERVKEAERLKSQFLANMSHDLRSPLNSILGFSELLLSGIDGPITPEQRAMLEPIHQSGRALLEQIDDILDTAKLEAGKLELHEEATPVAALIGRAIHLARQRHGPAIDYHLDVAPGLPPAVVDPQRSAQALLNVLIFARGSIERGTVNLRVRLGNSGRGRMILIEVHAPARPATADQLAKLRRGFYRIPGHRGLGLGLPLAGSILELQGGGLGIEDLGPSMTFTLHLKAPVVRANLAIVERRA